jgi:hypothetical protein
MQQSGQIIAHIEQPRHSETTFPACGEIPLERENFTGFMPRQFNALSIRINPLGQKLTHKRQPLHLSRLIVILGIFVL